MPRPLYWPELDNFDRLNQEMRELLVTLRRYSPTALLSFYQDNVTASQTNVTLSLGLGAVNDVVMPRTGHVIGIAVLSNAARTAGTLNVYPTIDGAALTPTAQLDATNTETHEVQIASELANAFLPGQTVGAEITTDGSWAPTTADIIVSVLIQFSMED